MLGRLEWETVWVAEKNPKPLRSRAPESSAFHHFMTTGWSDHPQHDATRSAVADYAAQRREKLIASCDELPQNQILIIPAGAPKQRSNDTDYPFRPHSAFSHLTGWGSATTPSSVLRIDLGSNPARSSSLHEDRQVENPTSFMRAPTSGNSGRDHGRI